METSNRKCSLVRASDTHSSLRAFGTYQVAVGWNHLARLAWWHHFLPWLNTSYSICRQQIAIAFLKRSNTPFCDAPRDQRTRHDHDKKLRLRVVKRVTQSSMSLEIYCCIWFLVKDDTANMVDGRSVSIKGQEVDVVWRNAKLSIVRSGSAQLAVDLVAGKAYSVTMLEDTISCRMGRMTTVATSIQWTEQASQSAGIGHQRSWSNHACE